MDTGVNGQETYDYWRLKNIRGKPRGRRFEVKEVESGPGLSARLF